MYYYVNVAANEDVCLKAYIGNNDLVSLVIMKD